MKKFIISIPVLLLLTVFSVRANADFGDLFIQVELNTSPQGCSILKVDPAGGLSEFISNAEILTVSGAASADCDDAGLAAGLDGKVYFNEDISDNIFVANPNGQLGLFISDDVVDSIVPGNDDVDWDNGLAVGPRSGDLFAADEDNEIIFKFSTNVPTPIIDTAFIDILATEADFEALVSTADLEGGIAVDFEDNVYITNDGGGTSDVIFKLSPLGDVSILCTNAELEAVTGGDIDLDVGAVFGGSLFVSDDGDCDCVLEIDTESCNPRVIITEDDITAATGNSSADLEGGLCIGPNRALFIGDDASSGNGDIPNILKSPITERSGVSIFVSDTAIDSFYAIAEPGSDPQLRGSCSVEGGFDRQASIPTLSEWGLIAMAGLLGIIGLLAIRRKRVTA